MDKFMGKYRIESNRLKSWDYSKNGYYFVTICTKNRIPFFGNITLPNVQTPIVQTPKLGVSTGIQLSEIGKIATKYWIEIPQHFPFVKLLEFIIMPDHVHGIIVIEKYDNGNAANLVNCESKVPTNKYKSGALGVIINHYKRKCTIESRRIDPAFGWLSRYYDIIIRDKEALLNIQNYIINNPTNRKKK